MKIRMHVSQYGRGLSLLKVGMRSVRLFCEDEMKWPFKFTGETILFQLDSFLSDFFFEEEYPQKENEIQKLPMVNWLKW